MTATLVSRQYRSERPGHSHVDDRERRTDGLREDVDGRSAADEVGEHLGGHVRWVGRDAPPCDAVVTRRHDDRAARHRRKRLTGDARQVDGELLEAAEAARRLREPVEVVASAGHGGLVQPTEPGDRGEGVVQAHGDALRHDSLPALQRHRQARHEQIGLVGHRREALVGDPDEVPVGPGASVHRHDPEPDLVAHDHDGSRTRLDRGEACRDGSIQDRVDGRYAVAQQRAEPEGQPVDEDRLRRLGLREGGVKVRPYLERRPRRRALTPMSGDAVIELGVAGPRGPEEPRASVARQPPGGRKSEPALAAARAADDEDQRAGHGRSPTTCVMARSRPGTRASPST